MVFVTGDTHSPTAFAKLNLNDTYPNLTKDDYLIVAGDFELLWLDGSQKWIEKVNMLPYTTLFIDGNYDNYDTLSSLPLVKKFGGTVGQLSDSIYWLRRGEIYNINGDNYLTIGGATSLNKSERKLGVNWWPQEELSEDERMCILRNASTSSKKIDFIISHTCPTSILGAIKEYAQKDSVSEFLEEIFCSIPFNKWFFGHMHCDVVVHDNFIALFNDVIEVKKLDFSGEHSAMELLD